MANDTTWQRRTDEWIDATNASRKRKEQRLMEKLESQSKGSQQTLKNRPQRSK